EEVGAVVRVELEGRIVTGRVCDLLDDDVAGLDVDVGAGDRATGLEVDVRGRPALDAGRAVGAFAGQTCQLPAGDGALGDRVAAGLDVREGRRPRQGGIGIVIEAEARQAGPRRREV